MSVIGKENMSRKSCFGFVERDEEMSRRIAFQSGYFDAAVLDEKPSSRIYNDDTSMDYFPHDKPPGYTNYPSVTRNESRDQELYCDCRMRLRSAEEAREAMEPGPEISALRTCWSSSVDSISRSIKKMHIKQHLTVNAERTAQMETAAMGINIRQHSVCSSYELFPDRTTNCRNQEHATLKAQGILNLRQRLHKWTNISKTSLCKRIVDAHIFKSARTIKKNDEEMEISFEAMESDSYRV
jgi:hypothetical protein